MSAQFQSPAGKLPHGWCSNTPLAAFSAALLLFEDWFLKNDSVLSGFATPIGFRFDDLVLDALAMRLGHFLLLEY
jgi:hypothetical protein